VQADPCTEAKIGRDAAFYPSAHPRGETVIMRWLLSLLMGFAGGGAAVLAVWKWLGDWLTAKAIEKERAKYGKEIEQLKAKYAQELERHARKTAEIEGWLLGVA
jgi:hypothetical protein